MRGTAGGSQNLCTGSFVLSNVCRAPNGGRTPLNLAAAHGVMGACSGWAAKGSEESQLFNRKPSGPLKLGFHVPDRSGMPPDITPVFLFAAAAGLGDDWAAKSPEKVSAAADRITRTAV